jgi:peptidoglycan-associated lipoprotein
MMNKSIIYALVMAMTVTACSSNSTKNATQPPAPVVDSNSTVQQPAPPPAAEVEPTARPIVPAQDISEKNTQADENLKGLLAKRAIYFDYDKDVVKPEYQPLVEAHAKNVMGHPDIKLLIQGNTDSRGSREYNLALGQRRAVAVKKALNLHGANDKQIETVSYGKEKANNACKDDACFGQDRRADFVYQGE